MFKYKFKLKKAKVNTTYGSICIENIIFSPHEIQKVLPEIIFRDENLKHMFAEEDLSSIKRKNIYKRFAPRFRVTDMALFVEESMNTNRSFYSFLAEGILGLVFRDIHKYNLAKGVVDVGETLTDSHTGVDACMYNRAQNVIVLGEAKFYQSLHEGINKIIEDFVEKSIKNKLESLQARAENCEEAYRIVIKNLAIDEYDELTINEFMSQKIIFVGFVLHSEKDISKYGNADFYDKYSISTQQLEKNICESLKCDKINGNYEIILVHLPIEDKKKLILKMIETSQAKLRGM